MTVYMYMYVQWKVVVGLGIGYTEYRVWYGVVRRGGQWLDYELPLTGV